MNINKSAPRWAKVILLIIPVSILIGIASWIVLVAANGL